ncbi:MAG: putative methyltransferase [Friedmanniella sp.]|nr:putative methyltransferase [Friedmanniella sp.]
MAEPRRRRSVSQTFLVDLLLGQLDGLLPGDSRSLDVVDLGGGTGGLAISLAERGHRVTVIDPSPDALASLDRRTSDAGLGGRIRGVQGDAADLVSLVGAEGADVVVCHRVLEVVDSPAEALAAMATVLRPGGVLSLLVSQRHSVVLTQALAGHLELARQAYADPARFDHDSVLRLVTGSGFAVLASHGIGAVADHVPESVLESEAGAYAVLAALEADIAQDPAFRALAPQVHVFAQRPARPLG